jgi:probable metal-binding protein
MASGRHFTTATLVAFIEQEFGPAARFHTCSTDGLTATELVRFLAARGKFSGHESAFTVDPARVCQH